MHTNSPLKLIVQIPCLNEEKTLPLTIADIPRQIPGIGVVEILVIDDGSTDRTGEVARQCGVEHIVKLTNNKGLAQAFSRGIDECLRLGADIIVNTDADNQYCGKDIPLLIGPILAGKADMVIGIRDINGHPEFSWLKKMLQKIGSLIVRKLSGTKIQDTTSGFRAYNAHAAAQLNVMTHYSYTLETLIQSGKLGIAIEQVAIRTNPKTRESRLFKDMWQYIKQSVMTIMRVYMIYQPLNVFLTLGLLVFTSGFLIGCRFLYYYLVGAGGGKIQSLILAAVLVMLGVQILVLGIVANLIAANRFILEKILVKIRELEFKK